MTNSDSDLDRQKAGTPFNSQKSHDRLSKAQNRVLQKQLRTTLRHKAQREFAISKVRLKHWGETSALSPDPAIRGLGKPCRKHRLYSARGRV